MTSVANQVITQYLPDYTLVETIYQGTRTVVYRALSRETQQPVVIKVLAQKYPDFSELVQFRNQYIIAKNLSISGIIRPLSLEPYGNGYGLVMEDVGGIDLGQYIQHNSLSLTEILGIAIQLANILHNLHQERVIHKDIKPANILIQPNSKQVRLIDFGIASLLPKEIQALQNPKSLEGTLAYLAPEQTGRMNRAIDYRTDFYALGVTLYQMLTGQLPFTSDDPLELIHHHIAQTPMAVEQINPEVPFIISAIVAKLMAKNAEDRYQSALGLKFDLEECLTQWQDHGKSINVSFSLGQRDLSDRFIIPEKLYGREAEVQTLLVAFDRIANGHREMMLVAGFSGIGKTAVVNEVHKPIVEKRGYFIKGKYDQFNRNIPFSAFVQAFRDLMGQLMSESDDELANWKAKILKAVRDNGQVLIDVIPELEQVIGPQPSATELSGAAAQNRFNWLFQQFIAVFTTPEHPLVIFLDDLQWADLASLDLMKVLIGESKTGHLLLIGAYRDNEVFPVHPLMLSLAALEQKEAPMSIITLTPLPIHNVNQLIAETLSCEIDLAQPLTDFVYQKTKGNPFFTTQFLKGLYKDKLLIFNREMGYWECDLVQIQDAALTDDVVEFMGSRLQKLPQATQNILELAACIGNQFDLETLAIVCESPIERVATDLWPSLQEGLILPITEAYKFFQSGEKEKKHDQYYAEDIIVGYRFLHDRVQQAAYLLIDNSEKQSVHLKIGKLLLAHQSATDLDTHIFEILNHFMAGIDADPLAISAVELVELAFVAGMKAKLSVAYQSAIDYFEFGLSRLPTDSWEKHYRLMLDLNREKAECNYFLGQFEESKTTLDRMLIEAKTSLDLAQIYGILMVQRTSEGIDMWSGVAAGLKGLAVLDMDLPTDSELLARIIGKEQQKVQDFFKNTSPRVLLELPEMSDPVQQACMKLLTSLWSSAYIAGRPKLNWLITLRMINLSLEYGRAESSSFAYCAYGMTLAYQEQYQAAYQFGRAALDTDRKFNNVRFIAKNNNHFSHAINPYTRPLHENLVLYQQSFEICAESGDLIFGVWAVVFIAWTHILIGSELSFVNEEIERYIGYVRDVNDQNMLYVVELQQEFVRGLSNSSMMNEILTCQGFLANPMLEKWQKNSFDHGINWYGFLVLQWCYLQNDYAGVIQVAQALQPTLPANVGFFPVSNYHIYYTISLIKVLPEIEKGRQITYWQEIETSQQLLLAQANNCPGNFLHKYQLVSAEIARIHKDYLTAIDLYDLAIAGAQQNKYIQEEALANELAANFYLDWGKDKIAAVYMQSAYYSYARWGAKAKTDHLEAHYGQLLTPILQTKDSELDAFDRPSSFTKVLKTTLQDSTQSSSTNISEVLDFVTVLQAAQKLSSIIELEQLLSDIAQIVLMTAGAKKMVLLTLEQSQWQLQVRAELTSDGVIIPPIQTQLPTIESLVPLRLIHYVKNTSQPVLVDEVKTDITGILEGYLLQYRPQSVFCLPLLNQGELVAIVYLEHPTTKGLFTPDRRVIIEFLCSQAAVALRNAQLYQQAQHYAEQLEQSQLQLVQNEKMATLGDLVAGVAHEVNNPIGFLNGSITNAKDYVQDMFEHLETYQAQHPPNEIVQMSAKDIDLGFLLDDFPKLLGSMQNAVDRIQDISTSLRTFSRADMKHKVNASLHDGINSTLLILKYRLKANEHRPAIEVVQNYGDLPEINCFPGQLNQVFMNILANAIDMFDEMVQQTTFEDLQNQPQRIIIQTAKLVEHNAVEIRISDNGKGISDEVKPRIFDHLFTTKDVGKGTGLGLAIARQIIVDTHGGCLEVQSNLEQGTEFRIQLPL